MQKFILSFLLISYYIIICIVYLSITNDNPTLPKDSTLEEYIYNLFSIKQKIELK